ncbi:UDP-4-amino-4,6-dideoxy-N-acetyl-beta-L-altrosamine transaminase [Pseudomonas mosselii]|uniref:UDP-4-amino-4, 6-dideoxy-N-acetyl-beta-L-altrosamine transaminase n=1 Tax=Pseudomonas mosselii TaxID=78327 RepID=UPI001648F032|nr:UDP-4-amino-4,6-dideoxy-N-acetyl-beta-L-altrosamine transaminase [Pseudomonas mosselii]MBC3457526.1 UDP-4-amino-4,6-dideoxy-N-acetyl-beta-L-altrosamine transaminase [Pseudomonas mosselii]MDH1528573.1 UDP-4-amino-4,6-dideoxy-N-acetyl-beta-L-altrosamine transaminase [Pseudomonas mosselii]
MIPYGRQEITQADIDAVVAALQSTNLTQGPRIAQFEDAVKAVCGARYALATNSATSALHIACLALGLGEGDWLWTTPNTFVASANCALYCGARVDFVDIDPKSYNLCPVRLEEKLKRAKASGTLPKVVVPVHFSGQSCDMHAIRALSHEYGFKVIEDASHAIGGKYQGQYIGGCGLSDITIFSFHPVKIITTAEGGMAVTNDPQLAEKMGLLRSHGITREPHLMTHEMDGPWYYQQVELGFNYRMTDLQAALGVAQIERLDEFVSKRHQLAQRYNEKLQDLPLTLPYQYPDNYSAYHLYVVRVQLDRIKAKHVDIFTSMREAGIMVNLHYIPVHTQPYYKKMGFRQGQFPEAERYYQEAISIPLFPGLTEAQQDAVIEKLQELLV